MSIISLARSVLPERAVDTLVRARKRLQRSRVARLPLLTEEDFAGILAGPLGLSAGDTVYVHSAVDQLNLGFPFYRILPLIRRAVGPGGTVLFPTYPNRRPVSSYEYLARGHIFDVRKTPSYTGLLTEFARRQRGAVRSLHPTKSVCAIGLHARELTATHQHSPYPYDQCSPYYKLTEYGGKIVGLGVWTTYLSFVYCVDDALKGDAPVRTYAPRLFAAPCVDYGGETQIVETYAHDMRKVVHDIPRFVRTHVTPGACRDLSISGMKFFRADAAKLFDEMLRLARGGITVYPRSAYSKDYSGAKGA